MAEFIKSQKRNPSSNCNLIHFTTAHGHSNLQIHAWFLPSFVPSSYWSPWVDQSKEITIGQNRIQQSELGRHHWPGLDFAKSHWMRPKVDQSHQSYSCRRSTFCDLLLWLFPCHNCKWTFPISFDHMLKKDYF